MGGGLYICAKAVMGFKTMRLAAPSPIYKMMCVARKWLCLVSEVAKLSHGSPVAMAIICNCAENPQNSQSNSLVDWAESESSPWKPGIDGAIKVHCPNWTSFCRLPSPGPHLMMANALTCVFVSRFCLYNWGQV